MMSVAMMGLTPGLLVRALFLFCFDDYVGRVDDSIDRFGGVGSGIFFLIGINYNCDISPLVVFVPIGV